MPGSRSVQAEKIFHSLRRLTTDPYVADPELVPEAELVEQADILVVGAPHRRYRELDVRGKPVVDVWNHLGKGSTI
jgi:UDP-N-acetyl-D-mannosaminuronic acid dehydrogenase